MLRRKEKPAVVFAGEEDQIIWKSPVTDFGENTALSVPFSHEAILVQDGKALDTYQPGNYVLNEETAPVLGTLFAEKEVKHSSEVYYINKSRSLRILWGTPTQLDLFDSMLGIPVRIGASGELSVKILNSRKLLLKAAGSCSEFTTDHLAAYFRNTIGLHIKDAIATEMIEKKISYYEINAYLKELSESLQRDLKPAFEDYGVMLDSFAVNSVCIPEEVRLTLERAYLQRAKDAIQGAGNAYCPKCGGNVPEGSAFCPKCGAKL